MYPTKQEPKIPDVADALGVTCIDLYEFMRRLDSKYREISSHSGMVLQLRQVKYHQGVFS